MQLVEIGQVFKYADYWVKCDTCFQVNDKWSRDHREHAR